jgi:hypothetical protein
MRVAIDFEPFFKSAQLVKDVFDAGEKRTNEYRGKCRLYTMVCVLVMSTISFLLSYVWFSLLDVTSSPRILASIQGILGGYIAYEFFAVHDVAADTVLHTYLWNKHWAHGTVQRYAPKMLRTKLHYKPIEKELVKKGLFDLEGIDSASKAFNSIVPDMSSFFPGFIKSDKEEKYATDFENEKADVELDLVRRELPLYLNYTFTYDLINTASGWQALWQEFYVYMGWMKSTDGNIKSGRADAWKEINKKYDYERMNPKVGLEPRLTHILNEAYEDMFPEVEEEEEEEDEGEEGLE